MGNCNQKERSNNHYFQFWTGYNGCAIATHRSVCSALGAAATIAKLVCDFWKTSDKKRFDECVARNNIGNTSQDEACTQALMQICNMNNCPQNFFDPLCKKFNV